MHMPPRRLVDALEHLAVATVGLTAAALSETPEGRDLTLSQWRALVVLAESDGQRVGELADRLGISLPSASRLVRRLERHGLVSAERDEEDRRATLLHLQQPGRAAHRAVTAARRERIASALAARPGSLPGDLAEALHALTDALNGNADVG
jgi:DNA-binding MarR family transcriptional regulator